MKRTKLEFAIGLVTFLGLLTICRMGCCATITGKIVPAGLDASVYLCDSAGEMLESESSGSIEYHYVTVKPDGSFKLGNLPPGGYKLRVECDGYISAQPNELITLGKNSVSGGHVIRLQRGAILTGKITPSGLRVDFRIDAKSGKEYRASQQQGEYRSDEALPSGDYTVMADANGYALFTASVKLLAPKTTRLDIHLQPTGSISGKITPSPVRGVVVARDRSGFCPDGSPGPFAEIGKDGTYRITDLPAGTYDLAVAAEGFERVVAIGPMPKPDTLTEAERQTIKAVFKEIEKDHARKDFAALSSHISKTYNLDAEQEIFKYVETTSIDYQVDYVAGQTGKTAVAACRVRQQCTPKPGTQTPGIPGNVDETWEGLYHFAYESGSWKITGMNCGHPEDAKTADQFLVWYLHPLPDEKTAVKWRFSGDPQITGIEVKPGAENKGHDCALTPVSQGLSNK